MNKKIFILVLIFFSFTLKNYSQTKVYTLDEALKTAVENSFDTKNAKLGLEKANAAVDEAFGTAMPSVNLTGQYQRNLKVPVFFMPNFFAGKPNEIVSVEMGAKNSFTTVASFTQILFNSAVFTAIGTSKIFTKASSNQYYGTISKTLNNVRKAYYGVLLAKSFNTAMNNAFKNGSENVEMVKKLYNEGMIPEFDKIRAEVALENLKPTLLQSESAVQNAMNGLKLAMGISVSDNIDVTGELEIPTQIPEIDENSELASLQRNNYDLLSLSQMINVNKDIIAMRKSEYYPTIALTGNYMYQGQSNTFEFLTAQSSSVGLNFSLSLFNGLQSTSRVQQAKIDLQTSETKFKQLEEVLKMQLKNSVLQIKYAKSKVEAQEKTVEQAQRGYEISLIRYKEGIGSQMEINDADNALTQAKVNKFQAIYELISAISDYENLTGKVDNKYLNK